ncbi:serpin family protein [Robertmurraya sp. DFI.2.37]|nr:serpin family protein [Robertmurraya sp. DFI.2.37]MDF1509423.1 serpin family protein [Robertmurraya sp. DFI.2.37]
MKKLNMLSILITLLILTTSCGKETSNADFRKDDYQEIVAPNNQLGFELFSKVKPNDDGNILISPISLFMALSMVFNGADGVTKDEMTNVLNSKGIDAEKLNQANASMASMLQKDSKKIQLNVANSIWLNEAYQFQADFAQNNQDYYNAMIEEIDPSAPKSAKKINNWVKENTNKKIEKIVSDQLNPSLVAMLINAIYFHGEWKYGFNKNQTENRPFYSDGETINELPAMSLNEELPYMENEDFQAVSLPYGDGEMSMKIFLPRESSSLEELEQIFSYDNWIKWNSHFQKKEGTMILPKFQIEYETLLNDALIALGMPSAFNDDANFSNMFEGASSVAISEVKQKTFLNVNEEGAEAAAVTSVTMEESAKVTADEPFYMEVNRPFVIVMTDEQSGTILFIGAISNPKEGE